MVVAAEQFITGKHAEAQTFLAPEKTTHHKVTIISYNIAQNKIHSPEQDRAIKRCVAAFENAAQQGNEIIGFIQEIHPDDETKLLKHLQEINPDYRMLTFVQEERPQLSQAIIFSPGFSEIHTIGVGELPKWEKDLRGIFVTKEKRNFNRHIPVVMAKNGDLNLLALAVHGNPTGNKRHREEQAKKLKDVYMSVGQAFPGTYLTVVAGDFNIPGQFEGTINNEVQEIFREELSPLVLLNDEPQPTSNGLVSAYHFLPKFFEPIRQRVISTVNYQRRGKRETITVDPTTNLLPNRRANLVLKAQEGSSHKRDLIFAESITFDPIPENARNIHTDGRYDITSIENQTQSTNNPLFRPTVPPSDHEIVVVNTVIADRGIIPD